MIEHKISLDDEFRTVLMVRWCEKCNCQISSFDKTEAKFGANEFLSLISHFPYL